MQQLVRTTQPADGGATQTPPAAPLDLAGIAQLQRAWLDAATSVLKMPLSGDVTQWIRAWGEAVGQVGLVNVNYTGSRDPQAEQRITGRYSYGSQLGRMMEVLAPYVKEHQAAFSGKSNGKAVEDFLAMADEIGGLKQASVEDLLAKVRQWEKSGALGTRLPQLRAGLQAIEAAAQAK
jgi:hypothetical protein